MATIAGKDATPDTSNPKDALGMKKIPMGAVPPAAIAHEACAMLDGELKYGFRNWRNKKVRARVYIDAAKRHIDQWAEAEETATDSGVHHLGHARACLGILIDAQENGNLIDDRVRGSFSKTLDRLSGWVKERMDRYDPARQLSGAATVDDEKEEGSWPPPDNEAFVLGAKIAECNRSGGKEGDGETEERYLEITMKLLDRMSDKEYLEAIGKIERLVKEGGRGRGTGGCNCSGGKEGHLLGCPLSKKTKTRSNRFPM